MTGVNRAMMRMMPPMNRKLRLKSAQIPHVIIERWKNRGRKAAVSICGFVRAVVMP